MYGIFYRWERGEWVQLKRPSYALGRLMHVNCSSRNKELYHLRLLLLHVRGPTSFKSLLSVDGTDCETFEDACDAWNIAAQDFPAHEDALNELVNHANPWQIRNFFANLIVNCNLTKVRIVWQNFRDAMTDDYRRMGVADAYTSARADVLRQIKEMDLQVYKEVKQKLTLPTQSSDHEIIPADEAMEDIAVGYNATDSSGVTDEEQVPNASHLLTLTLEQRQVYTAVMDSIMHPNLERSNIFSLMAPAGTGKTYLYTAILNDCRSLGIPYIATAFTAIAALLLPEGETCHRAFGIPIRCRTDGNERSHIENSSVDGLKLTAAKLVVIDECSMISKWQIKLIDCLLRMVKGNNSVPFGGCTVVLGGDMGQILPVRKGPGDVIDHCITQWEHWSERRQFTLTKNMRAADDPAFADWVSHVRDGSANFMATDSIVIPDNLLVKVETGGKQHLEKSNKKSGISKEDLLIEATIKRVFNDLGTSRLECAAILCPTNKDVRDVNKKILQKLAGEEKIYYAKTSAYFQDAEKDDCNFLITQEELDSINASNLPPHELKLKVGAIVMLMINMNKKQGMCNGTRFVVTQLNKHSIGLKMLKPFNGSRSEIFLPRMRMQSDDIPVAGTVQRYQFPICLAFAFTINKSQGQSIDYVGLYLRKPVFCHGQFYVAVSRGRLGSQVSIAVLNGPSQGHLSNIKATKVSKNKIMTKNIVIKSLLV